MAQRRMFSPQIIDSDAFLDMPITSQSLYFHLCMRADDDGFVGNPKKISRMVGVNDDDLKILVAKRFILNFDSGVIVIKHWLIHNLIRADLYKETSYKKEKLLIGLNENGSYTELRDGISELKPIEPPKWLKIRRKEERTANVPQTALRLGKDRLGKVSKDNTNSLSFLQNIPETIITEFKEKGYTKTQILSKAEDLYLYCESKGKRYKNYKAFLLNALKKDFGEEAKRNRTLSPAPTTPTVEITSEQQAEIEKKKEQISNMFKR